FLFFYFFSLSQNYEKEWYRRNFTITFLMARVTLQNMWNNLSPANGGKKNDPTAT
uniref:Uncharacterized protein n=1 Tax=Neogobius melanostomus TaxID=47308 RepID=A0A8C6S607_9GOBI